MNRNTLRENFNDKTFSDIELVLSDTTESITVYAHKIILICSSDYFKKMFAFGLEQNQTKITIKIFDAKILRDLIASFYGIVINYNGWTDILKMFKCRKFFCLDNDPKLLYDIKTLCPNTHFELLLEAVDDFIDHDNKILDMVKKSIPDNYDLTKIPLKIAYSMVKLNDPKIILIDEIGFMKVFDNQMENMQCSRILYDHFDQPKLICIELSSNLKYVAASFGWKIIIWQI